MRQVSGGWDQTPAVDGPLPTTRLPNSRSICTSDVAGKMATTWKIGCVPRRNSDVTRNCEQFSLSGREEKRREEKRREEKRREISLCASRHVCGSKRGKEKASACSVRNDGVARCTRCRRQARFNASGT